MNDNMYLYFELKHKPPVLLVVCLIYTSKFTFEKCICFEYLGNFIHLSTIYFTTTIGRGLIMEKNNGISDLFLYFIGIILTVALFLFSNSLSLPFIVEFNSGEGNIIRRMLDIMFSNDGHLKILFNLFFPLVLQLAGIVVLSILMFKLGYYIISDKESIINKGIFSALLLLALCILIKAFLDSWTLLLLTLILGLICIVIFLFFTSLFNSSSKSQAR